VFIFARIIIVNSKVRNFKPVPPYGNLEIPVVQQLVVHVIVWELITGVPFAKKCSFFLDLSAAICFEFHINLFIRISEEFISNESRNRGISTELIAEVNLIGNGKNWVIYFTKKLNKNIPIWALCLENNTIFVCFS